MSHVRPRALAASLAFFVAAAPLATVAAAGEGSGEAVWTPALAAVADHAQQVGAGPAPSLGAAAGALAAPPLLAAIGMQAAAAAPSLADAADRAPEVEVRDETQRWVPSLALTSTILGQEADGTAGSDSSVTYNYLMRAQGGAVATNFPAGAAPVGSCEVAVPSVVTVTRFLAEAKQGGDAFAAPQLGNGNLKLPGQCRRFTANGFLRPATVLPVSGSNLFLTPVMGLSAEVMTPGIQAIPGRPRLFAHGDADVAFAFKRDVAKEGVPTSPRLDTNVDLATEIASESNWLGTGSRTSGEVQPLVISGGMGVAFTLDALERRLRIKPSVEYLREDIQVTGQYLKIFRVDSGQNSGLTIGVQGGATTPFSSSVFLDPIQMQPSRTQEFHGIGPGLEVEMDAARAGPVVLSLFLTGQAYKMLGDLSVTLQGRQVVPAQPPYTTVDQTVTSDFDYNIHAWSYRGGAGLRFRWLPED